MHRLLIGLAALLTLAAAPGTKPDDEIIVEGHKLSRDDIGAVVHAIARPEPTGGFESQYSRWDDRICVLVAGFPQDGGQFIADRIGQVARDLKLKAGAPGCSPNIFVLATHDPAKLIASLRLKRRGLVSGQDVAVVRRIQQSHDAVRWIGSTSINGAYGAPTLDSSFGTAGHTASRTEVNDGGSRLEARTQVFLTRETIIVDAGQIDGVSYGQLADYLAFVALAQLNPHATTPGVPSILSLFPRGEAAPEGLTAFDKAYLAALYQINVNAIGGLQRGQIEASINKTLRKASPAVTEAEPQPSGH